MATATDRAEPEAVFLNARASQARQQLGGSLAALPRSLERAVSPRAWTVRFPWATTGATVLGVFGLAVALQHRMASPGAAASQRSKRPTATSCPVRQAGIKTARLARRALHQFVVRPLKAAVMARMQGMF